MSENNSYNRLDSNGLLYLWQRITALFQAKENGKGLSTNDYTTAEKTKLGGIATGAQVNTIEGVQRNGADLTPDSTTKKVNVVVPVLGVQQNGTDLTPDSTTKKVNVSVPLVDNALSETSENTIQNKVVKGALDLKAPLASPTFTGTPSVPTAAAGTNTTQAASTAFVKTAIENALSGKIDLAFSFLQALPQTGVVGTFYFIPATVSESGVDEWEEYVWDATNSQFERIGAATLDLTDYFNTTNLPAITNAQIDTILAT